MSRNYVEHLFLIDVRAHTCPVRLRVIRRVVDSAHPDVKVVIRIIVRRVYSHELPMHVPKTFFVNLFWEKLSLTVNCLVNDFC